MFYRPGDQTQAGPWGWPSCNITLIFKICAHRFVWPCFAWPWPAVEMLRRALPLELERGEAAGRSALMAASSLVATARSEKSALRRVYAFRSAATEPPVYLAERLSAVAPARSARTGAVLQTAETTSSAAGSAAKPRRCASTERALRNVMTRCSSAETTMSSAVRAATAVSAALAFRFSTTARIVGIARSTSSASGASGCAFREIPQTSASIHRWWGTLRRPLPAGGRLPKRRRAPTPKRSSSPA